MSHKQGSTDSIEVNEHVKCHECLLFRRLYSSKREDTSHSKWQMNLQNKLFASRCARLGSKPAAISGVGQIAFSAGPRHTYRCGVAASRRDPLRCPFFKAHPLEICATVALTLLT